MKESVTRLLIGTWLDFSQSLVNFQTGDYRVFAQSYILGVKFTNSRLSFSLFYFSFLFLFCFIFLFSIFRTTRVRVDRLHCYISHLMV